MYVETTKTVTFLNTPCCVQLGRYRNGRLAIMLQRIGDDAPIAAATVNVPAVPLEENQVLIKDYGENEGMLAALEAADIVRWAHISCRVGDAHAAVCRLLVKPPTEH